MTQTLHTTWSEPVAQGETCANCLRTIGRLETAMVLGDAVVCPACHVHLSAAAAGAAPTRRVGLVQARLRGFSLVFGVITVAELAIWAAEQHAHPEVVAFTLWGVVWGVFFGGLLASAAPWAFVICLVLRLLVWVQGAI